VEEVQKAYGGPQAPNYEDANIVAIKASPGASHPILNFYFFNYYLYIKNDCALG
jgi:hypothetical protein